MVVKISRNQIKKLENMVSTENRNLLLKYTKKDLINLTIDLINSVIYLNRKLDNIKHINNDKNKTEIINPYLYNNKQHWYFTATVKNKFSEAEFLLQTQHGPDIFVNCTSNDIMDNFNIGDKVITTKNYQIIAKLPESVDPLVKSMLTPCNINLKFSDLGGYDEIKNRLKKGLILPVLLKKTRPEIYKSLKKMKVPKGILFIGPPGCGKTEMAKIISKEINANFFHTSGAAFVRKYVGEGARLVDKLFDCAIKMAIKNDKISIIFIDEIHAICGEPTLNSNGDREVSRTSTQFLVRMDGFTESDNVVVIGATTRPELLDKELIRSGRFDEKLFFPLPNEEELKEIWKIRTRELPLDPNVNLAELASLSLNLSGADIKEVVRKTINNYAEREFKLEETNYKLLDKNIPNKLNIQMDDFLKVLLKPKSKPKKNEFYT